MNSPNPNRRGRQPPTPTQPKRRKSLRLPDYDYASPGAYFITPCAWRRKFTFEIPGAREAIQAAWDGLLQIFGRIELDEFVIMPNHVHGIIWILEEGAYRLHPGTWGDSEGRGEQLLAPTTAPTTEPAKPIILGNIVGAFKTAAASAINTVRNDLGATVWQRNYYEHIIRNDCELHAIREYICNNPLKWALDLDNPANWARRPQPKTVDDYLRDAGVL